MVQIGTDEIIERLYRAPLTPEGWRGWLQSVVTKCSADHAILFLGPLDQRRLIGYGLDQSALERLGGRDAIDLGRKHYYDHLPEGQAVTSATIMSDREMIDSPFYREVLKAAGGFRGISLGQQHRNPFVLSLCRGRRARDFEKDDTRLVQAIHKHLVNVLQIDQRLHAADTKARTLLNLLNHSQDSVVIVDGSARILHRNASAESLIEEADGLSSVDTRLAAGQATPKLRHLIARMSESSADLPRASMFVERPSGRRPLRLRLAVVSPSSSPHRQQDTQIAIFTDAADDMRRLDRAMLRTTYRLTPRECDVCQELSDGLTIDAIAARLNVSRWTIRHHLKLLFLKTETHSQIELVRFLRDIELR